MVQRIKATYQKGAFLPEKPYALPEGTEVELTIEGPFILQPDIKNLEERKHVLKAVVERMRNNPIPENAPEFTRESLHERR